MAQKRTTLTVDGTPVSVSNLDKPLYPNFTKAQVIDYYVRVADYLLPHLKDRPVTLKRYPDGIGHEHFYEKDAPSYTPEWVERYPVPRRGGGRDIQYILINDLRTLVWCANLANLEIHPFLHRAPNLDQPDSITFDLDPGEGADILSCAQVAFWLKDALERMNLESFAKVSGSKGIQVSVPLNTPVSYKATQPLARALAQLLEKQHPDVVVSEMAKDLRTNKVFIDWNQNSDFKTTVGVYSLRAKRQTPFVSLPVEWQELKRAIAKGDSKSLYFEPEAALARLRKIGDLFGPVLTMKQRLEGGEPPKPLRAYATKRNFSKTPEPAAAPPRRSRQGSRRRFVIQKHAASHLHYDFRLEMHDVLKSWAVPKGLPYTPGERRLAAVTEDHPLEYFEFEGTIPKGQYGGGTVMVWDIGTYELLEGNYYKGRLHFFLSGKKLKGEWVLERENEKNWRLIKSGDAVKPVSAKQDDRSAVTGRTMKQIAETSGAQWHSNRTRTGIDLERLPAAATEFVEPMQAKPVERLPEGELWLYEVKFDGYRALAVRDQRNVRLLSRNNNDLSRDFPGILKALKPVDSGTVIDGELVALDPSGRPSFHVLQNRRTSNTPVLFYAFDLPVFRGRDLRGLTLWQRRALLEKDALAGVDAPILLSANLDADPDSIVAAVREQGLEGVVAKRAESNYEPGKRSGAWLKLRVNKGQELVIGGYKPRKNGFESLLAGYYDGERLIFIAKVRNGFTPAMKREVAARFAGLESQECPFANLPEPKNARRGEALTADVMKQMRWLKPELVAQVEYADWTEADHLRHSKFVGLREDKRAQDVTKER